MEKLSLAVPKTPWIAPLCYGLDQHPGVHWEVAPYATLAEGLAEERYDAVLLPPWMAWSTFGIRFLPGIGLSAMESPGFEHLFLTAPWQTLTRIYITDEDKHLLPVLQLLYAGYASSMPQWEIVAEPRWELATGEGYFCGSDATFPALNHVALAELWREQTGLPWVFHAWATRFRAPYARLRSVLTQAWQEGHAALQENPETFAPVCHRLSYRLASLESEGLRHLATLAQEHEIAVPQGELTFC